MEKLFASISKRYDAMNKIMSLGLDFKWRRHALKNITMPPNSLILDLACGTGDFTVELCRKWPHAEIACVDLTPEMISVARKKLSRYSQNITFMEGDAQNLSQIKDRSCSLIVCAFGFRNFPDKAKALSECYRILDSGGKLVVLELFRPDSRILGALVDIWLAIVSWIFAGDARSEYKYLRKSVASTLNANEFVELAEKNRFRAISSEFFFPAASCVTFSK